MRARPRKEPPHGEPMSKLNVDTALIETLAELLQRTGLTEIELAEGEARIRVARQPQPLVTNLTAPAVNQAVETAPATPEIKPVPTPSAEPAGAVRAPMVGTVYLTPEPGAAPFVSVGDEVGEGQTLLIIEAMKVMNPIRAAHGGRVTRLMVGNGDPVEYGELLLVIE